MPLQKKKAEVELRLRKSWTVRREDSSACCRRWRVIHIIGSRMQDRCASVLANGVSGTPLFSIQHLRRGSSDGAAGIIQEVHGIDRRRCTGRFGRRIHNNLARNRCGKQHHGTRHTVGRCLYDSRHPRHTMRSHCRSDGKRFHRYGIVAKKRYSEQG